MNRLLFSGVLAGALLLGQEHDHHHHAATDNTASTPGAVDFLLGQGSGTAIQPAAWPMPMKMNSVGDWRLMWMGQAFVGGTQQSGPRGGDKIYSANWGMLGAARPLGRGAC